MVVEVGFRFSAAFTTAEDDELARAPPWILTKPLGFAAPAAPGAALAKTFLTHSECVAC